ncbi:MAG: methylmalonyl-CoA mutase family protein [Terracidiphilus sp.]|jgi:methylmalonyl-CoA mutase
MATEHLLEEFPPVSTAEWEAAIARDLKGADYDKKLIWRACDLAVKPYYRAADLEGLACLDAAPGEFPFRRGARAAGDWRIREEIEAADAAAANRAARQAVAAGTEEIAFANLQVQNSAEHRVLIENLDGIAIHLARANERTIRLLLERLRMKPRTAEISTGCDALESIEFAAEIVAAAPPGFVPFTIHGEGFDDAGATAAQEIGFALAAGIDFLAAAEECGAEIGRAAAAIEFSLAVGANFFFQIAKLRAFRTLWARAVESFGGAPDTCKAQIAARTTRWNKTVYDPHVNILRATTEAMAAALGGADSVTVTPFDACYEQPGDASRRLARNTQLLLKHEASLGRVADASGGSYLLESLTDLVAGEGWKRMQEIEARGGFRKAQADGTIARALEQSRAAREKAAASRRRVFVGTNQFADPAERALDRVDSERIGAGRRGARLYEELRLRTERHVAAGGGKPRVLLAEIGDAKMRMARSNFAADFFACAGFETIARRFKKAAEIAAADGDLIALCSSDEEYADQAAELMPALKAIGRSTPVIVAGNPESAGQLTAAGIADFVHWRSNPVEVLTKWQERLGIKS